MKQEHRNLIFVLFFIIFLPHCKLVDAQLCRLKEYKFIQYYLFSIQTFDKEVITSNREIWDMSGEASVTVHTANELNEEARVKKDNFFRNDTFLIICILSSNND